MHQVAEGRGSHQYASIIRSYNTNLSSVLFFGSYLFLTCWPLVTYLKMFHKESKKDHPLCYALFFFLEITAQHSHIIYSGTIKIYRQTIVLSTSYKFNKYCWPAGQPHPKKDKMSVIQWFLFVTNTRPFINSFTTFIEHQLQSSAGPGTGGKMISKTRQSWLSWDTDTNPIFTQIWNYNDDPC